MQPDALMPQIFAVSEDVRYVAIYQDGELTTSMKPEAQNASASESDKYEELIVNPSILTLAQQRGNIDCGGCRFVLIRYGNFYQLVTPTSQGHVSICIEPHADPLQLVPKFESLFEE